MVQASYGMLVCSSSVKLLNRPTSTAGIAIERQNPLHHKNKSGSLAAALLQSLSLPPYEPLKQPQPTKAQPMGLMGA